ATQVATSWRRVRSPPGAAGRPPGLLSRGGCGEPARCGALVNCTAGPTLQWHVVSTPPISVSAALEPVLPSADAAEVLALEAQLRERENELNTLKLDLQDLQSRHLTEIGPLYRDLAEIEDELIDLEIRAGLRPPPEDDVDETEEDDEPGTAQEAAACDDRGGASADVLKRVFRDVAKNIHPDLAMN